MAVLNKTQIYIFGGNNRPHENLIFDTRTEECTAAVLNNENSDTPRFFLGNMTHQLSKNRILGLVGGKEKEGVTIVQW